MIYWNNYKGHQRDTLGKRKVFDNNIYSLDIETTNYIKVDGVIYPASKYDELTELEQQTCTKGSFMYIWMFSINDVVYYGRTWQELTSFLTNVEVYVPEKKYLFIHNLSFEFQYLRSVFEFSDVLARTSRHVMKAQLNDFDYELRCTYLMSNVKLSKLADIYELPVKKMVGDLDYNVIRNSLTPLTEEELGYCENDCLIIYYYILMEREMYGDVKHIPLTSTGHVRKELKDIIQKDFKYKRLVNKAINVNPHVYNLMLEAFAGGYTHANIFYTDTIVENVDSWDFTSSYPYVMVTHKYPSSEFRKCILTNKDEMIQDYAYLMVVRFKNIRSKYYNNFISKSKCRNIKGARYDNGRIIRADSLETTITDVDFRFILESHENYDGGEVEYEILESYYSLYRYLPETFINFILDKYVTKTKYKNVEGKELEYALAKAMFNALYGMAVTNTIKDEVLYDNIAGWDERALTNEEIEKALENEKKQSFLNFAWGVWITAYARNNLLKNLIKLDDYAIYCDTDSIKLAPGYDKKVIDDYNDFVTRKIKFVSKTLNIDIEKYAPKDVFGEAHMLGLFDSDGHYDEFITQGAKKYCYTKWKKKEKVKDNPDANIIEEKDGKCKVLEITVAGVPKKGAKALKSIEDFKDDLLFSHKDTGKNMLAYVDEQDPVEIVDDYGNKVLVTDKTGCCVLPTTYILGKAFDYVEAINDLSSERARYKE